MGWLVSYTLASIAASLVVLKIFDYIFAEAASGLVSIARVALFIITWAAVTAKAGMHGFSKGVRQVKQALLRRVW